MVSKDLYVLRRASELFQGVSDRFTPNETDWVELMETWGAGFYTELDFINEANNQIKFKKLIGNSSKDIYVPDVYMKYCRRRILVTEWVDGIKLSMAPKEEMVSALALCQECFLRQLLEVGFFHNDPHPGNLLLMDDRSLGKICILDFGLMIEIPERERQNMISAIIHVSNKNYDALTLDFI